jgi:hypothetical protein
VDTYTSVEVGELVFSSLDVGGDRQIGRTYNRRFICPQIPGAVVDVTFYVHASTEPPEDADEFAVYSETETTLCRDVSDPGGTEIWSRGETDEWADMNACGYRTVEAGEVVAERLAREYDPYRIDWAAEYRK